MKTILLFLLASWLMNCCTFAYELPEVIAVIEGEAPFAVDFSVIPDLNGDGRDEFLVFQPFNDDDSSGSYSLYFGGENFGDEPDYVFRSVIENAQVWSAIYLPNPIPDMGSLFLIGYANQQTQVRYLRSCEYLNGNFSNNLFFGMNRCPDSENIYPVHDPTMYPFDMNNDGWSDFVAYSRSGNDYCSIHLFLGGADLDTIPDWSIRSVFQPRLRIAPDYSTGYDVNADDYDDLLTFTQDGEFLWYEIYLGGSPIDTVPACRIKSTDIEGRNNPRILQTFSLLPDINGDGYDDWAVYWKEYTNGFDNYDGVFVFFGGEELDWEPDLELEGHRRSLVDKGFVAGGDINGDEFGDVICSFHRGTPPSSEIHIHFGSRWMDTEADIYIDTRTAYNGAYHRTGRDLGAIGDYNGDGVDDFVARGVNSAVVFSGNQDWEVGVSEERPTPSTSTIINAYPNPFNQKVKLSFNLNPIQTLNVRFYDVNSRLIDTLYTSQKGRSMYETTWTAPESGLYFVVAESGSNRYVSKILCIR
ncbi:MAG: T9SS type A sorting domain-containing protein [Calditrichaeota bacterium]|nr:T9SS type A sorting domain-containing protein [Calditrichota bacterium]